MGYRTYIGFIPKREYNKIKSLTATEFQEYKKIDFNEDFIASYDIVQELYEFGKYAEFAPPKGSMLNFFKKRCLREHYEEYDFVTVKPEFLEYVINNYKERIKGYYNEMLNPLFGKSSGLNISHNASEFLNSIKITYDDSFNRKYSFDFSKITEEEQTALFSIIEHVRSFRLEWTHMSPFILDKGDEVTASWKFEYGIFELVRIYKSFDWKKNVMVYYGY